MRTPEDPVVMACNNTMCRKHNNYKYTEFVWCFPDNLSRGELISWLQANGFTLMEQCLDVGDHFCLIIVNSLKASEILKRR